VFSQHNANKGDRYFDKNLFQEAIKYYQLETKSGNRKYVNYAKLKIASCYRILGEFEMAEDMYRKLLKSKRNREDPFFYLSYGKSLKSSAKYAEAKIQFKQYIKLIPEDPMGPIFLHSCDSAQKWLEETIGKEVKSIKKINTTASDFSPIILNGNKLVISSSRKGSKEALISFDGGMKVNRLDLYGVDINSLMGNEDIEYVNFSELNSPLHEGSATFSSDGKEIYFTRTVKGKRERKGRKNEVISTLQVFYSTVDSTGEWSEPISAFSFNSSKYSVGQPSLSKDGEKIFFMSDMDGGHGSTDIYYCEKRENGLWAEPENAGSSVNTFGHELFPYIADNGMLYFSSDTHIGMGKLDIFSSEYKSEKWANVQNLKPPYNSIADDFGIVFDSEYSRGFFSSDRFNGVGAEDIYSFSEKIAPLEITFKDDSITFSDYGIYDGLKYSFKNKVTIKDTTLVPNKGAYLYALENSTDYVLVAKKNRFSVYNKVELNLLQDTSVNYLEVKIKPEKQPIYVNGFLTFHPKEDTTNTVRLPLKNIKVVLMEANSTVEKTISTGNGYFNFETKLEPNKEYILLACKGECDLVSNTVPPMAPEVEKEEAPLLTSETPILKEENTKKDIVVAEKKEQLVEEVEKFIVITEKVKNPDILPSRENKEEIIKVVPTVSTDHPIIEEEKTEQFVVVEEESTVITESVNAPEILPTKEDRAEIIEEVHTETMDDPIIEETKIEQLVVVKEASTVITESVNAPEILPTKEDKEEIIDVVPTTTTDHPIIKEEKVEQLVVIEDESTVITERVNEPEILPTKDDKKEIIEEVPTMTTDNPIVEAEKNENLVAVDKEESSDFTERVNEPRVISKEVPIAEEEMLKNAFISDEIYTIQLLSLSSFSQEKIDAFAIQHNLNVNKIKIKKEGVWTKVVYEETTSLDDAKLLKAKLLNEHNLEQAYIAIDGENIVLLEEDGVARAKKYTIQLLSLTDFSKEKLNDYCIEHKLSIKNIKIIKDNGGTKVTYGGVISSIDEAIRIKKRLVNTHNVTELNIVQIKQ